MLVVFASLVLVFLLFKAVLVLLSRFFAWLGKGEVLQSTLKNGGLTAEHAQEIKQFVAYCDEARMYRRRGIKASRPKLSKEQKNALRKAAQVAREKYLDLMNLSWYQLVIIFLVGSVSGLIREEVWMYITAGLTQSRVGLIWGPFSPIYGFGAVFLTILTWQLRQKNAKPYQVFLLSCIVGGLLEQATGWTMEHYFHMSSWTYAHLPDHITQWVAWRFLVMWGLLGLVWYRYVMGEILFRIGMPTTKRQILFVGLITLYFVLDITMTMCCFVRMAQRNEGIPPSNSFEVWIDHHYTNQFIEGRFQNMVIQD